MKKVFVAMSGGVDSSVSAALLQKAGYDVTGVFIRVWTPPFLTCDWPTEREDARRVAAHLGVPFSTIDLADEYKKGVVDYMIDEYKKGRTPNPDVMCNAKVKFGSFLQEAIKRGADYIATGHYAQVCDKKGIYEMRLSVDDDKDQTYFLWKLGQKELSKTLFPIGGMHKSDVRALAKEYGIPVAGKKDSQGICFLGDVDMKDFLTRYIETREGDVLNVAGEVIGTHEGALLYTRGQRRGFRITKNEPNQQPLFVIRKNIDENTITVGTKQEEIDQFGVKQVRLTDSNEIAGQITPGNYMCRFRHRQSLRPCHYENGVITFNSPQDAVSVGQSLVMYSGTQCVGGGVVDELI